MRICRYVINVGCLGSDVRESIDRFSAFVSVVHFVS